VLRRALSLAITVGAIVLIGAPASAGGGCHSTDDRITQGRGFKGPSVPMETCAFTPTILYVEPGQKIIWVNQDPVPHTVTGALLSWGSESAIQRGETVSYRFDEAGVYPYYCIFHPGMAGAVVVGEVDATEKAVEPIVGDGLEAAASAPRDPPSAQPAADVGISTGWAMPIVLLSLAGGLALYVPMRSAISAIMRVRSKSLGV
jgi:plastocyanin